MLFYILAIFLIHSYQCCLDHALEYAIDLIPNTSLNSVIQLLILEYPFNCNCYIFVNAPYFDTFTHRLRGADGLPWWSPSQVLITN
jgi:hypothetical protein